MKMTDINQKLTEKPGGFGGIMKNRLRSQIPFARGQQRKGKAKVKLLKLARQIKKELQDWKNDTFAENGEDTPLTMSQFLEWVKKKQPKYAAGMEAYARGEKAYAAHFTQAIDSKGRQSSTASDPKVKPRKDDKDTKDTPSKDAVNTPSKDTEEDKRQEQYKMSAPRRTEITQEDEDDEKPKSDTSASIYEERLRAMLEDQDEAQIRAAYKQQGDELEAERVSREKEDKKDADVGVNSSKTLSDNQIDTIIVRGIQKQREQGADDAPATPKKSGDSESRQSGDSESREVDDSDGGDSLSEYKYELTKLLKKVQAGKEIDKRDKRLIKAILRIL